MKAILILAICLISLTSCVDQRIKLIEAKEKTHEIENELELRKSRLRVISNALDDGVPIKILRDEKTGVEYFYSYQTGALTELHDPSGRR